MNEELTSDIGSGDFIDNGVFLTLEGFPCNVAMGQEVKENFPNGLQMTKKLVGVRKKCL